MNARARIYIKNKRYLINYICSLCISKEGFTLLFSVLPSGIAPYFFTLKILTFWHWTSAAQTKSSVKNRIRVKPIFVSCFSLCGQEQKSVSSTIGRKMCLSKNIFWLSSLIYSADMQWFRWYIYIVNILALILHKLISSPSVILFLNIESN
jgi:hypothetical protein